jgi:hypothetical protein
MAEDVVYTFGIELQTGSFTDLTTRVERASWGQTIVDMFNPPQVGRAMFELANDDGTLSPRVNSSFQPGRNVRLTATHSSVEYPLFTGRITDVSLASHLGQRTTLVEAVDDWDRLTDIKYTTRLFSGSNVTSLFTELMSLSSVRSFTTDTIGVSVGYAWYNKAPAVNALHEIAVAGNFLIVVDGNGTFGLRQPTWSTFDANSTPNINVSSWAMNFRTNLSRDTVYNRIKLSGEERLLSSTVDTVAFVASGFCVTLPASSSFGFWFDFHTPNDASGADCPVGSFITPVASQDWYVAQNSDGTGTNMTSGTTLAITGYGSTAVATFTNNTGANTYLVRAQARGYILARTADIVRQVDITSSQTRYGLHALEISNRLLQYSDYVGSFATHIASDRKDGMFTAVGQLRNVWPSCLQCSVGTVIQVVDAFSGPTTTWRIRGTQHELTLTEGLVHDATYDLDTPQSAYGWGIPTYPTDVSFNPASKNSHVTLSSGNLKATGDGTAAHLPVYTQNATKSSGKWYCEFTIGTVSTITIVGVATAAALTADGNYIGVSVESQGMADSGTQYFNATPRAYGPAFVAGDVISVVLNMDGLPPQVSLWKNGVDLGAMHQSLGGYSVMPAASLYGTGVVTLNLGATPFVYSIPAGYSAFTS